MEGYEQLRVIGRGASGNVYLARRLKDDLSCVQKSILIDGLDDKAREETKREVRILRILHHPYITGYYDSEITPRMINIIMEYAEGGTLRQLVTSAINKKKIVPESQILDWIIQIALALKFCHDKGILHRDLKSDNVFLNKDRIVKLGDFGLAKVLSSQTKFATTILGTPYYMSPEVCSQSHYGRKNDVWALGVIMYEMLELQRPFTAESIGPLVIRIMKGVYNPISDKRSPEVKDMLSRMLTTDVEDRISLDGLLELPFLKDRVRRWREYAAEEAELGEQSWQESDLSTELANNMRDAQGRSSEGTKPAPTTPAVTRTISASTTGDSPVDLASQHGTPEANRDDEDGTSKPGTGRGLEGSQNITVQVASPAVQTRHAPSPPTGPRPRVGSGGRQRSALVARRGSGASDSGTAAPTEPSPNTSTALTDMTSIDQSLRTSSPSNRGRAGPMSGRSGSPGSDLTRSSSNVDEPNVEVMYDPNASGGSFEGSPYGVLRSIGDRPQFQIPVHKATEGVKGESGKPPFSPGTIRPGGRKSTRRTSVGSSGTASTNDVSPRRISPQPPSSARSRSPNPPVKSPGRVSFVKPSLQLLSDRGSRMYLLPGPNGTSSARHKGEHGGHHRFDSMPGSKTARPRGPRVRSAPLKPSHNVPIKDGDSGANANGDGGERTVHTPQHRKYNQLEPLKQRPSTAPIMIPDTPHWLDDPSQWP